MSDAIKVDIWSDIACPWCFIGKRKFEAGVAEFGGDVEIEYHSYQLTPDTPVDFAGSVADSLVERKGLSRDQVTEMFQRVSGVAAQVGLEFDFDAVQHTNTVLAHELLHFAKANGVQREMKERLLSAYFIEGLHVGRIDELADLAAEVGLDRADAHRALSNHEYLEAVRADEAQATEYGIRGVPFFVIDGRFGVSGAQDATTFAAALQQVRDEKVVQP